MGGISEQQQGEAAWDCPDSQCPGPEREDGYNRRQNTSDTQTLWLIDLGDEKDSPLPAKAGRGYRRHASKEGAIHYKSVSQGALTAS